MLREDLRHITINDLLNENKISIRTSNCCFNGNLDTLYDIIKLYEQGESFRTLRNAGLKTCMELEYLCKDTLSQLENNNSSEESISKEELDKLERQKIKELINNDLFLAINNKLITPQDLISFLSPEQLNIIATKYNELIASFSVRTQNCLKPIQIDDFILYYLLAGDNCLLQIKQFGKKSLQEGIHCKQVLKEEIFKIIKLPEGYLEREKLIQNKSEWLKNDFVFDFYQKTGSLPMFWILEQELKVENRNIEIFIDSFPIFKNQKAETLETISKKFNITRERTRQIRNKTYTEIFECVGRESKNNSVKSINKLCNNKANWEYLLNAIFYDSCITDESFDIQKILDEEQCKLSVIFVLQIIAHIFSEKYSLFGGLYTSNQNHSFLIKKELVEIFNFEKFIDDFNNYKSANAIEYDLDLDEFLSNSDCWNSVIDLVNFDNIVSVVKDILLYEFQLYSNIDGSITVPATKERNPMDVLYEILQKNGEPMHLEEIFVKFKEVLPEHKYTEATQLRPWLQRHEAISYRNRSSVYTLKEWKHIKSGTIRDAIVEFLLKNDLPRTAEDITEYVLLYFPKTNISSIRTSMFNDTQNRFSFFGDSLFGLQSKDYPAEYGEIEQQETQRKSFEQRLYDLENFLTENDHFPFSTSDNEEEASLYRWWRIQNKETKLSDEQKADVERIKNQYADFETEKIVYEWFYHFNDFKLFVLENRRLPSASGSEKFLYGWFRRAKDDFLNDRLNEKQRTKYAELFKEIKYVER